MLERNSYIKAAAHQIAITPREKPRELVLPGASQGVDSDECKRRAKPSVDPPVTTKPTEEEFYTRDRHGAVKPDLSFLRRHFLREGRLTEDQAIFILECATKMFSAELNLLSVQSPVTVCGDIHGQYYDLMKIFEVGGDIADNVYLFLGDYVDRGCFGIECLLYLYVLKLWHPSRIFLLRGNHECRHLTEYFTFKRECLHKYSDRIYDACIASFNALPLAAVIDRRFFCVHGGISPDLHTLQDLERLNRFQEPGPQGLLCDLLWADPAPNFGYEQEPSSKAAPVAAGTMFINNDVRGCSYYYTYEAVCAFLERNGLLGVFRGHEVQDAGYTMYRKTPTKKFPSVITMFSAPNYIDVYHNRGAVLKYANKNITIRQYYCNTHPYWLPNFMDGFTWSLPFVGAKIAEMLLAILSICSEDELSKEDGVEGSSSEENTNVDSDADTRKIAEAVPSTAERRQQIRNKILTVGRIQTMFTLLREGSENVSELSLPTQTSGALGVQSGPDVLGVHGNQDIRTFKEARDSDIANERLPIFDYNAPQDSSFPIVAVPSMRGERNMKELIKKALEEGDSAEVERLADRIVRDRKHQGRPRGLRRFETA